MGTTVGGGAANAYGDQAKSLLPAAVMQGGGALIKCSVAYGSVA
jgi:hypothetical protein